MKRFMISMILAFSGASLLGAMEKPGIELPKVQGLNKILAVATDKADKKIAVGFTLVGGTGGQRHIAVARFNKDGTTDKTFGYNGIVTTQIGNDSIAEKVAIADDGKILVTGHSDDKEIQVRYNSNGTLDLTFRQPGAAPAVSRETASALLEAAKSFEKGFGKSAAEIVANPNIVNNNGDTPLLYVARYIADSPYTEKVTKALIAGGANINYVNPQNGFTPLIGALDGQSKKYANTTFAEELINKGAAVNAAEKEEGLTPLMLAARYDINWISKKDSIIPALLKHGANPDAKDREGLMARDLADERNLSLLREAK